MMATEPPTATTPEPEDAQVDLVEAVLAIVEEETSVEDPWTDRGDIVEYAYVDGYDDEDAIRGAIQAAVDAGRLFSWHGLIVLGEDDRLRAMQEEEARKDYTRRILMRKATKHRRRLREEGGGGDE